MSETALPIRTWGAFMPPNGVGGGGVHWNAETWRFLPTDFVLRTHLTQRYGARFLPADMTIQDWGVTYAELEPHYDRFEYLCGTCGHGRQPARARSSRAAIPFEGPRSRPYPNPPQAAALQSHAVRAGGARAGLQAVPAALGQSVAGLPQSARRAPGAVHATAASASGSAAATIPRRVRRRPSCRCWCASPISRRAISARSRASTSMRAASRATGVTFVDTSGQEWEQPADLVILCGLHDLQRAAAAALEDRPALRPGGQSRRHRPQLHPPDDLGCGELLRSEEVHLQSLHRLRRHRHVHR